MAFFHFGASHKVLKTVPFKGQNCPNCHGTGVHIVVVASYFYLWFIPIFPLRKKILIKCTGCQYIAEPQEISDEFEEASYQLKSKVRTPFYLYFGILVIILLTGFCTVQQHSVSDEYIETIKHPEVNDIYTLYDEKAEGEGKYYLWKVVRTNRDITYVLSNGFYYTSRPIKLAEEDGFYQEEIPLHKNELLQKLEAGEITHIRYGQGFGTGFNKVLERPDQ